MFEHAQSEAGELTWAEAERRLARDGPNELPPRRATPLYRRLASQLFHLFALMLWGAGVLAVVAGMPELGVAIFVIIVINGAFAFVQEHRAERAAEHLEALLPRRATVRRSGRTVEVDARELVVGDRVLLTAGDRISADLRIVESHSLRIDASLLTGESESLGLELEETAHAGTHDHGGPSGHCRCHRSQGRTRRRPRAVRR